MSVKENNSFERMNLIIPILILILISMGIRFAAVGIDMSYENDVLTFQLWSTQLYEGGLSQFYSSEYFTDYPPLYMYILYVLGWLRSLLNLEYLSPTFNALIRLPAIICDTIQGLFIFIVCRNTINRNSEHKSRDLKAANHFTLTNLFTFSFWIALAYILNPAIIMDSAVWGQVDSVYTLILFLAISSLFKRDSSDAAINRCDGSKIYTYLLFGTAVMMKPQSLIISPVFLYSAFSYLQEQRFQKQAFLKIGMYGVITFSFMALLALPFTKNFDFSPILNQYVSTLESYPYATLNAYNFFALAGQNWQPLTLIHNVIGITGILFATILALQILHRHWCAFGVFFTAALLNTFTFMFSVKMHERYLFPTLLFLLMAFIYACAENKNKNSTICKSNRMAILYAGFSATFLFNCIDVLRMLAGGNQLSIIERTIVQLSLINALLTLFMLVIALSLFEELCTPKRPTRKKRKKVYTRKNILFEKIKNFETKPKWEITALLILIFVYSCFAFYNLGDTKTPQTTWTAHTSDAITIDFGDVVYISRMQFLPGARHDIPFMLYASDNGIDWHFGQKIENISVFAWSEQAMNTTARYVQIIPFTPGLMLQETAFRAADDTLLNPYSVTPGGEALIDEHSLVPLESGFMNSTYFDEIYHARTAYEYIHGLNVYEGTHPPLGKDLMALSIKTFGMTPFAWRLPGTIAGILMIPLIYIFARMVFRSSLWALFAAFVFTFDFMHFAQTRLATIDSFVTLFILSMFVCMYAYVHFCEQWTLKRSLLLLALSGISMGLAIAVKWPGIYASAGLAVLFFPAWYRVLLKSRKDAWITIGCCFVFFAAIPLFIYALSYIPFVKIMDTGEGFIATVIANQFHMFNYHANQADPHPFSSHWWEWPIMARPIFYFVSYVSDTVRQGISSFGNPAVWWMGVPALVYAFCALFENNSSGEFSNGESSGGTVKLANRAIIFILVAYAAQYLPWVLVSRSTYIYHYFPSIPFVVLLITLFFKDYFAKKNPYLPFAYAVLTLALFIMFYPVLSGMPVKLSFVENFLRWFPGWVLV